MEKNPILDEIHRAREKYAARFHYDLKAMYRDLKAREERGDFVAVHRSPRPPRVIVALKKRSKQRGAA
jgi:hypothetical protein